MPLAPKALLLILLAAPTWAQAAQVDRLEQLKGEVAGERAALEALRAQGTAELESLRTTRRGLAQELLAAGIEEERARTSAQELVDEAARLKRLLERRLEELQAIQAASQTALERMAFSAQGLPGRELTADEDRARALEIAELRRELGDADNLLEAAMGDDKTFPEFGLDSARSVFSSFDLALDDAAHTRVQSTRIFSANGQEEQVDLLSAGRIAFAYRAADGRIGLALASPIDASGYRWSEELDDNTKRAVGAAIDALAAGKPSFLPIDPTGQIRPDSLATQRDLAGRLVEGGPLMIPLGLVALAALGLCLERFVTLFLRNRRAHGLALCVLEEASNGRVEEAKQLCAKSTGILPRTLSACLARAHQGQGAMEDGIQEQLLNELPLLSRFLRTLAILASVAPLIGLLGTVTGIIQTFGVIKALGTTDPTSMAGGISVALVTTAVGLSVAIPTLLAHGLLKGRGDRLIADAERYAASLLTLLVHGDARREA